jgi:hypothetical protein
LKVGKKRKIDCWEGIEEKGRREDGDKRKEE